MKPQAVEAALARVQPEPQDATAGRQPAPDLPAIGPAGDSIPTASAFENPSPAAGAADKVSGPAVQHPGVSALDTSPAPVHAAFSVMQQAPGAREANPASPGLNSQQPADSADRAADPADVLVRGASIEAAAGTQRMNVLLQDDRLGRIALHMVERAGLVHAVLRTDDSRGAQLITGSLPSLLESLSQRGLLASWTSSYSGDAEPQADPRQGQSRRQRQSGGQGGRREPARSGPVFQIAAR